MANYQDGEFVTFITRVGDIMPRKCKHRRFRLDEAQNDSDPSAFKIGTKNVLRWLRIKQQMGFNSDTEFAEYLLTIAEHSSPCDSDSLNTIQPLSPLPNEETVSAVADTNIVEDADVPKCEPLISLVMECDEH